MALSMVQQGIRELKQEHAELRQLLQAKEPAIDTDLELDIFPCQTMDDVLALDARLYDKSTRTALVSFLWECPLI